jgi:hypothetical protein
MKEVKMNEKIKNWIMRFDQATRLTEKRKKWLLDGGQLLLGLFLGNMTTIIFQKMGYIEGDLMVGVCVIGASVLWFIYMDFLKWIAKKVPDEKRKQETEVCDKADH